MQIASGLQRLPLRVPFACTISSWDIAGDQSGSIVIDIWKDTYANYPPVNADSITGSVQPTVSGAIKAQGSTLTGWTTTLTQGDFLFINVDSVTAMTWALLSLHVTRT